MVNGDFGSPFNGPGVGEKAPDFTLETQDGKERISLSRYRGQKPVVLIFGNLTCGVSRSQYGTLENLYQRAADDVAFLAIYVREAHPADVAQLQLPADQPARAGE